MAFEILVVSTAPIDAGLRFPAGANILPPNAAETQIAGLLKNHFSISSTVPSFALARDGANGPFVEVPVIVYSLQG